MIARDVDKTEFRRRMEAGRLAANPAPRHRLACPTTEHGEGVILYVNATEGWCHCERKLRIHAIDERLVLVDGRVRTVKR